MKYQAVIFDLGGTLVHSSTWQEFTADARKIAALLSAPGDEFVRVWFKHIDNLVKGAFPDYRVFIRNICNQLHLDTREDLIFRVAEIPYSLTKRNVTVPRDGAMELISFLKSNGYKIGLVSDCAPDLPEIWPETPFSPFFDVTIFSCSAGMNKGDPRIFQLASEKLGVSPGYCLFIADGMRNELANAASVGIRAVQIIIPGEVDDSPLREDWRGPVISSLHEVYNLLK